MAAARSGLQSAPKAGIMTNMEAIKNFFWNYICTYSVMAAVGILAVFIVALVLCFKRKQNWTRQLPLMMASLIGMIIGAKLFGMLSLWTYFLQLGGSEMTASQLDLYMNYAGASSKFVYLFENSGIVFYGGLLGYFLMYGVLSRLLLKKRRLGWDIVALTTPLFHGFARIGCYLGRAQTADGTLIWSPCCYGVQDCDSAFCSHFWDSRLPVQLFESAFNFLLFGTLLLVFLLTKKEEKRGWMIRAYLIAYGTFRFVIEFFRDDAIRGGVGPLSFSQWVSLGILLGVAVYYLLREIGAVKPLPIDPDDPDIARYDLFRKEPLLDPIETTVIEEPQTPSEMQKDT